MNGWWWCLIIAVVWIVGYNIYNRGEGKRRQDNWDMCIPSGAVWLRGDVWYTEPQTRTGPTPRLFNTRSNPLDHELEWETVPVPDKYRRIPHEVEY